MKNLLKSSCPIARCLNSAGDAWSLLILRDAFAGLTRFDQFRKSLGIAPTILTRRLGMLTTEGLLEKRLYSERPPREEYVLTKAGLDFLPILVMIGEWGRKYRNDGGVTQMINAETGQDIIPTVIDAVTGSKIEDLSIRIAAPENL